MFKLHDLDVNCPPPLLLPVKLTNGRSAVSRRRDKQQPVVSVGGFVGAVVRASAFHNSSHSCEKSKSTLCRKSWVFSGHSGFLPQGKLTGWIRTISHWEAPKVGSELKNCYLNWKIENCYSSHKLTWRKRSLEATLSINFAGSSASSVSGLRFVTGMCSNIVCTSGSKPMSIIRSAYKEESRCYNWIRQRVSLIFPHQEFQRDLVIQYTTPTSNTHAELYKIKPHTSSITMYEQRDSTRYRFSGYKKKRNHARDV